MQEKVKPSASTMSASSILTASRIGKPKMAPNFCRQTTGSIQIDFVCGEAGADVQAICGEAGAEYDDGQTLFYCKRAFSFFFSLVSLAIIHQTSISYLVRVLRGISHLHVPPYCLTAAASVHFQSFSASAKAY